MIAFLCYKNVTFLTIAQQKTIDGFLLDHQVSLNWYKEYAMWLSLLYTFWHGRFPLSWTTLTTSKVAPIIFNARFPKAFIYVRSWTRNAQVRTTWSTPHFTCDFVHKFISNWEKALTFKKILFPFSIFIIIHDVSSCHILLISRIKPTHPASLPPSTLFPYCLSLIITLLKLKAV